MPYPKNPYHMPEPSTSSLGAQVSPNIQGVNVPNPGQTDARMTNRGQGGGGLDAAGAAGMIGAAAGLVGNAVQDANTKLGLDEIRADPAQNSPDEAPVYTGGDLMLRAANARPKGASAGQVLSGAATGASAGVTLGPVGAAAGAVIGAGITLIGGGIKKKRQRRERNRALGRANAAAQDFNSSDIAYRQRAAAREDYADRTNDSARQYYLYKSQMGF